MGADINAFAERRTPGGWEICRRADRSLFVPAERRRVGNLRDFLMLLGINTMNFLERAGTLCLLNTRRVAFITDLASPTRRCEFRLADPRSALSQRGPCVHRR